MSSITVQALWLDGLQPHCFKRAPSTLQGLCVLGRPGTPWLRSKEPFKTPRGSDPNRGETWDWEIEASNSKMAKKLSTTENFITPPSSYANEDEIFQVERYNLEENPKCQNPINSRNVTSKFFESDEEGQDKNKPLFICVSAQRITSHIEPSILSAAANNQFPSKHLQVSHIPTSLLLPLDDDTPEKRQPVIIFRKSAPFARKRFEVWMKPLGTSGHADVISILDVFEITVKWKERVLLLHCIGTLYSLFPFEREGL